MFILKEDTPTDKIGEGTDDATKASIQKWLEGQGLTIRSQEQDESFIQSKVQSEVDTSYRNQNNKFDDFIKETTGVAKNANEKTTEYFTRSVKEKFESIAALQKKVTEFENNGIDGNKEALRYKKELETSQEQVATLKTEYEEKLQEHSSSVFKMRVDADVEKTMSEISKKFREDVDEKLMKDIVANRLANFHNENKAVDLDGHIIYQDKDGKTRNGKKDGKPMNTSEVISGYFDDLKKPTSGGGAGSGRGAGGAGGDGDKVRTHESINLPADVKTKVQLMDHLVGVEKMNQDTKEFSDAYEVLSKGMAIK